MDCLTNQMFFMTWVMHAMFLILKQLQWVITCVTWRSDLLVKTNIPSTASKQLTGTVCILMLKYIQMWSILHADNKDPNYLLALTVKLYEILFYAPSSIHSQRSQSETKVLSSLCRCHTCPRVRYRHGMLRGSCRAEEAVWQIWVLVMEDWWVLRVAWAISAT